jgi:hypothetical protein
MMEAARTSETLVNFYQTTRRYNLEDSHLQYFTCLSVSVCLSVLVQFEQASGQAELKRRYLVSYHVASYIGHCFTFSFDVID